MLVEARFVVSPNDESRDKLAFFARLGVAEVWLLDPQTGTLEMFAGDKPVASSALGIEMRIDAGELVIRDGDATHTVRISE